MNNKAKAHKIITSIEGLIYGDLPQETPFGFDLLDLLNQAKIHFKEIGHNDDLDQDILKFLNQVKTSIKALQKAQDLVVIG